MKPETHDGSIAAAACPRCGATVVNVQGVTACQRCNWAAR